MDAGLLRPDLDALVALVVSEHRLFHQAVTPRGVGDAAQRVVHGDLASHRAGLRIEEDEVGPAAGDEVLPVEVEPCQPAGLQQLLRDSRRWMSRVMVAP